MVLDAAGLPVACFLEWAEVVRDGVVVDYAGAVDIVRRLVAQAQERVRTEFTAAGHLVSARHGPPAVHLHPSRPSASTWRRSRTSPPASPTCSISIARGSSTSAAAPPGRRSSATGRSFSAAICRPAAVTSRSSWPGITAYLTRRPRSASAAPTPVDVLRLALPTLQRMCDIVAGHIQGHPVDRLVLTGGTCCLPGGRHGLQRGAAPARATAKPSAPAYSPCYCFIDLALSPGRGPCSRLPVDPLKKQLHPRSAQTGQHILSTTETDFIPALSIAN